MDELVAVFSYTDDEVNATWCTNCEAVIAQSVCADIARAHGHEPGDTVVFAVPIVALYRATAAGKRQIHDTGAFKEAEQHKHETIERTRSPRG